MYIPALGIFIVDVPKNGSSSLSRSILSTYPDAALPGHIPVSDARAVLGNVEAWALIRDPLDRFVSSLNFVYGRSDIHIDDAMNGALRHQTVVMQPQARFVDPETRLFPFEALRAVLAALGCPETHENASTRRWTAGDILDHPRGGEALTRYACDAPLRDKAMRAKWPDPKSSL